MAVTNTALIYINGINYTPHAVMPFKWANFLDEQLDEAHVSLRHVETERFEPFTPVEVVLRSVVSFQGAKEATDKVTKQFIVATDTSEKSPIWAGYYDHELYIIELTKLLESIVIDTCTFTNDSGRTYAGNAQVVEYTSISSGMPTITNYPEFYSPLASGTDLTVYSADYVWYELANSSGRGTYYVYNGWVTVTDGTNTYTAEDDTEIEITVSAGCTYTITYTCEYQASSSFTASEYSIVYVIACVDNVLPLKKWTIKDVVNRLCDIAEPLRKGEYPRFYFNEEQAEKYDYILAPEFSFTKSTFRECLQQVGGVIHGEPRLTAVLQSSDDTEGYADAYRYEISFDEYGGNTYSSGTDRRYIKRTVSQSIDSYATEIDSSPENLINRLDKYEGVIVEPFQNGYRSVRTDSMYAQITDETMLIETTLPIYTIEELIAGIQNGSGTVVSVDITDYVFESTLYSSQLSSYSSAYPYSKAYGIMYTQGEKNITQLNFKQENPVSSIFSKYAIVNIINEALGDDADWEFDTSTDYPLLMFRVTYTPLYSARTGQTKPDISGLTYPATQLYNQTANMIETRYYGENMKGAVARFGNPDKAITYKLARLSQIPTAGEKYDSDYYISAVESELLPTCIRTTITLTKDFNRLSQYVGISSEKRFSEVSQGQAAERSTLWKEYIVIGDQIDEEDEKYGDTPYCAGYVFTAGMFITLYTGTNPYKFTTVRAWGETGQESSLNAVYLPIVSSSFGNSLTFTWSYKDNYSAGTVATKVETEDTDLYYQDDYRYTDYYGKLYYYHFIIENYGKYASAFDTESGYALELPSGAGTTVSSSNTATYATTERDEPIILRKDNRERLLCNYQIDFVSNRQTLFIGSAFPAMFSSLAGTSRTAHLYILDEELPKFSGHLSEVIDFDSLGDAQTLNFVQDSTNYRYLYFYFTASTGGKAWVLLTERTATEEDVEDELGNTTTQTVYEGGDVLLAENKTIGAGAIYSVYLTTMRKIFNPPVWVDKT